MRRQSLLSLAAGIAFLLSCSAASHAQAGRCTNGQINQAYAALRMTPNGSGSTGDCNPANYGAGSWTGLPDLEIRIQHAHDCPDPWIGQIIWYLYGRKASPLECPATFYGGGHWSSYMDLTAKIQAAKSAKPATVPAPTPSLLLANKSKYYVAPNGDLIGPANVRVAVAGHYLINAGIVAAGGGNIVAAGGGNIVAAGGGNLVSPQAGMVVNTNGSNFIVSR